MATPSWTKALVQSHAQVAVAVELYTLPFYLTALTSLQETVPWNPISTNIYNTILSVCMEEMLHLELAANLCLAVGTTPNFTAPIYGQPIPYLDPDDPETGQYALVNAVLGPLNQTTLDTMLNIETPAEFEVKSHSTPNYPYGSIGEMYDALLQGIQTVGWAQLYVGNTTNQQAIFGTTNFSETIGTFDQAQTAVNTINEEGEGKAMQPVPTPPFTIDEFPIPAGNQLTVEPFDPAPLNMYSHYGRFVNIDNIVKANQQFPAVYTGVSPTGPLTPAQQSALTTLQTHFADLLSILNSMWAGGAQGNFFNVMMGLLNDTMACWQAGVIPMWSAAQARVTPRPLHRRTAH
jgi:hypothetical protein